GLPDRGRGGLVVVDEERAHEPAAEIGQGQALGLAPLVGVGRADHEVDQRELGVSAVDRERRDAGADDDREREEALADDLAERLERTDALADALEPAVGTNRIELELTGFGVGHRDGTDLIRATIRAAALPGALAATAATAGAATAGTAGRGTRGAPGAVPVDADGLDAAAGAEGRVAPRRAALKHAHVAEREVVRDGVGGIEPRERAGDLFGGLPRCLVSAGETQGPRHPPQEQEQALAPARAARIGQEVRRAAPRTVTAQAAGGAERVAPGRESLADPSRA